MLRHFIVLALLGVGAAPSTAPPAEWPLDHYVKWQPEWGSRTISAAGLTGQVEIRRCGIDRPASEGCGQGDRYLVATLNTDDGNQVVVTGEPGVGAYVGIGKLTPGAARPSLILISENGGSAGCAQIDLAVPQGATYRSIRLSADPADHGTFCQVDPAKLAWPRDLTGNGRPEFVLRSTAFYCRFTSCAGTWYPSRVVAFDGARGIDVSADPALAPLYRADMVKARYACQHDAVEAQGACAGYAADASRLGELAQAWRIIDAQVRRGCRVPATDGCADINRIPASFPADLAAALQKAGYR